MTEPLSVLSGGEIVERTIPGVGTLRFENFKAGQWLTQAGQPARTSRRRYLLNGEELDSASTIVGCLHKEPLLRWYEKNGAIGAVQAERMGELDGVDDEDIIARVRLLKLGADAVRDDAANRGKAIHTVFETFARTGEPPNPADYPPEWQPWLQGAARAWLKMNPEPAEIETIVCHPERRYAGRFDFICALDGRRVLIDYKSGRGRLWPEGHYQTRLYADALEPSGIEPVDGIVLVGVDDRGGFTLMEGCATSGDVEHLLAVYRSRKRLESSCRGMAA